MSDSSKKNQKQRRTLSDCYQTLVGQRGLISTAKAIAKTINDDRVFVYAGQASMMIILSIFPFIMLLFSLIQYFLPFTQEQLQTMIASLTDQAGPLSFLNDLAAELFSPPTVSVVSITAITSLWSASRGVNAVKWGLRTMYHTPSKHGYVYNSAVSLLYTVALFAILIFLLLFFVFGRFLLELIQGHFAWLSHPIAFILRFRTLILLVVLTLFFMLLYRTLPGQRLSFAAQFPGALFSTVGWALFSLAFSLYINNFAHYSYIYGSLTAIVLLMLWLYTCMVILLLGAEINAYLLRHWFGPRAREKKRRQKRVVKAAVPPEGSAHGTDPS